MKTYKTRATKQHVPLIEQRDGLLKALKALVAEIRAYSSPECDDDDAIGAQELKDADAAIARAEGAHSFNGFAAEEITNISLCVGWTLSLADKTDAGKHRAETARKAMAALERVNGKGHHELLMNERTSEPKGIYCQYCGHNLTVSNCDHSVIDLQP